MSGRGAYYKAKYGGGRGGRGGGGGRGHGGGGGRGGGSDSPGNNALPGSGGGSAETLIQTLHQLDNSQYPRYHSLETVHSLQTNSGGWVYANRDDPAGEPLFVLSIQRTQSDPFAKPTRLRVFVPAATANFPAHLFSNSDRRRALSDRCLRAFYCACVGGGMDQAANQNNPGNWSGPKGGDVKIMQPGQNVLAQSAVAVQTDGSVLAHFTVSLPARGRSILGQVAANIFGSSVPQIVRTGLLSSSFDPAAIEAYVYAIEDQANLRRQLSTHNPPLVAFVADNSVLPRSSGAVDTPLVVNSTEPNVVPFASPPTMSVTLNLNNQNRAVVGMGIPEGVTVIVGGGFHGKSTLLTAIQLGVYDKIPGDGREFIVTRPDAVKVRAEDGRQLHSVDIRPFINNLPFGRSTAQFTSRDASGSTSQAANVMEALEMGSNTLIFDEDTCATNFMIRDAKMAALVHANSEPITPFISRVSSLFKDGKVSSIMVVGGAGDYLNVADKVLMMSNYSCNDVTPDAKAIISNPQFASQVPPVASGQPVSWTNLPSRSLNTGVFRPDWKCAVRSKEKISYGDDIEVQLFGLEQLVAHEQTNSILQAMHKVAKLPSPVSLRDICDQLENDFENKGLLQALTEASFDGTLAQPRKYELAGAISRLRLSNLVTAGKDNTNKMVKY
ncbi:hypothetical protein TrST_g14216 [Triparma strigata]|uniref:ATPase n=1 Tax=Triparma strigata TaxID=1606541 RepID=A0A9W7AZ15_9STRA|nr:hypothetical protein TrST_g14216 [Triparma strigata]